MRTLYLAPERAAPLPREPKLPWRSSRYCAGADPAYQRASGHVGAGRSARARSEWPACWSTCYAKPGVRICACRCPAILEARAAAAHGSEQRTRKRTPRAMRTV
ncbi:hypothetical protein ACRAWD_15925 [Caulobacter segnis]